MDKDRGRRAGPLAGEPLRLFDAWWHAANYLSAGQLYLLDNPLLERPVAPEDLKPRLLGHWGTVPGLNFVYALSDGGPGRWFVGGPELR